MTSKLIAAKIAMGAGCDVILAKGETLNPLVGDRDKGARHTIFRASRHARRRAASAGSPACCGPKARW